MKTLIALLALTAAGIGQANASEATRLLCHESSFGDRLLIDVNLETSKFVVTLLTETRNSGNGDSRILGRGRAVLHPESEGDHVIFSLYERFSYSEIFRLVGTLRAREAGQYYEPSTIDYKNERVRGGFYCSFID